MDGHPTLSDATARYAAQLRRVGVEPIVDADDDGAQIQFEYEGETYYLDIASVDPQRASFTVAYEVDASLKTDRAALERRALRCAADSIGVVVTLDPSADVEFRHDAFVHGNVELGSTLERILAELRKAHDRFFDDAG